MEFFAKHLVKLPLAGTYGVAAGVGCFSLLPLLPYVLGDEYAGAVEALPLVSTFTPFLKALALLCSGIR